MNQAPIFCLSTPVPVATRTATGYSAHEVHSLSSVAARIAAPKSTVHKWITDGDLPCSAVPGGYKFQSNHLEEFALRIKLLRAQKQAAAAAATELSAVLENPPKATGDALLRGFNATKGQSQQRIFKEISRRCELSRTT